MLKREFSKTAPFVVLLSLLITVGVSLIDFQSINNTLNNFYYILLVFTLVNNLYQVATHILTTFTFIGFDIYIPGGADENQTILNFTFHNQLDLWGWWAYFILKGEAQLIYNLLSSTHISTGLFAMYNPRVFQAYYIKTDVCPLHFHLAKIIFVLSDAIARSYALYNLV